MIDRRDEGLLFLQYDPLLEPLFHDPRWRAAMRRMGFTL
jgi:hypothetical protein